MYLHWLQDSEEKHEFASDYSIFIGSFSNPESAKKMMDARNPKYSSTDEEFEKASEQLLEQNKLELELREKQIKSLHRRRRRKVLQDN